MLKRFSYLIGIFSLILLYACGSNNKNIPVPKDAATVFHINGKSLLSKLSWEEIKATAWFKQAYSKTNDSVSKILLNNPEASGIDMASDFYFFMHTTKEGSYSCVTFPIKDESKFNATLHSIAGDANLEKEGNLTMVADREAVATWSKNRFVAIFPITGFNENPFSRGGSGYEKELDKNTLVSFAKGIHDLSKKESLGNNDKFVDLLKEEGDFNFWSDAGSSFKNMPMGILGMTNIGKIVMNNYTAAAIHFEDGKITGNIKGYLNKELTDIYKKNKPENFDTESLKKIPSDNIVAAMAGKFPLAIITDIIELMGMDGLINMGLAQLGLSVEDITNALKGDFILSVSDFTFDKDTKEPQPKFLFGTSIGDQHSFDKLISEVKKEIAGVNNFNEKKVDAPFIIKEGWLLTGSDSSLIEKYGSSSNNHSFISKISGHPFGLYVDLQKIINNAGIQEKDSALIELSTQLSEIIFYGGNFSNNSFSGYGELNFTDKKTNSLKQLNLLLDKGFLKQLQKEKKEDNFLGFN